MGLLIGLWLLSNVALAVWLTIRDCWPELRWGFASLRARQRTLRRIGLE